MSSVNPRALSIEDFTYDLPKQRIAKYPLEARDQSKLLVYKNGQIQHRIFNELSQELESSDCLFFNDTRVIHARLFFQKPTGAHIEVFCLEPLSPKEITQAFDQKGSVVWKTMVGNAKRFKVGEDLTQTISADGQSYELTVEMLGRTQDSFEVKFSWNRDCTFAEVLEDAGTLPIPPYLNRDAEVEDEERYQTMYAQANGSVAAPTAGLHFTQRVLDDLKSQSISSIFVTLHVGAGTFKPVKSDTMQDHEMHQEQIDVSLHALQQMRNAVKTNRIVAVGTTSLRTIESIYWFGVKLQENQGLESFTLGQWDPYELSEQSVSAEDALDNVLAWMHRKELDRLRGNTQLIIALGYTIRLADALITNFHQPKSTLLLLVASFIGDDWRKVYEYALKNDFRFLSFGDSSILFRNP
jgi:S-adenosylmethionine:tRNA ribosyltransferase-isomerase